MFVYLENAHNISSYKPVFQYNGDNIDELIVKIKGYLEVQTDSRLRIVVYDRRFGSTSRRILTNLHNVCEDVYVVLKVEDAGH